MTTMELACSMSYHERARLTKPTSGARTQRTSGVLFTYFSLNNEM
jgi:hypothetical protein